MYIRKKWKHRVLAYSNHVSSGWRESSNEKDNPRVYGKKENQKVSAESEVKGEYIKENKMIKGGKQPCWDRLVKKWIN